MAALTMPWMGGKPSSVQHTRRSMRLFSSVASQLFKRTLQPSAFPASTSLSASGVAFAFRDARIKFFAPWEMIQAAMAWSTLPAPPTIR